MQAAIFTVKTIHIISKTWKKQKWAYAHETKTGLEVTSHVTSITLLCILVEARTDVSKCLHRDTSNLAPPNNLVKSWKLFMGSKNIRLELPHSPT
jgi:hypothetical protein